MNMKKYLTTLIAVAVLSTFVPVYTFASVSPMVELTFSENTRVYGITAQEALGKRTGTLEEFARAMENDDIISYVVFPGNYFNAYESGREVFGGIYSQGRIVHNDFMSWGAGFDGENRFRLFSLVSTLSNERGGRITVREDSREVEIVTAFNCYPWLMKDGERYPFAPGPGISASFLNSRAQRAFMGQKSDGTFVYGMLGNATIQQLQDVVAGLGLVNAVNTDGGASAGIYRDGRYLARPGRELASVVFIAEETAPEPEIQPLVVNPTPSTVFVNNAATEFEAYLIEGNNFFKLRDLAFVLNGTEKQFEVGWDEIIGAIELTSGQPYTHNGSEMKKGDGTAKQAVLNDQINISKDGVPATILAYLIEGYNFIRLRDLMQLFDVYVGFDETTNNITIDTSRSY